MSRLRDEIVAQMSHLRRYARALTGHPDNADDLVQDCLTRAWSRIHLWREGTDLRRWLFTIMHNLHVNAIQRATRIPSSAALDEVERQPARHTDPADALHLRDLHNAYKRLSAEQREVLFLVAVEGMSYQEVAELLVIPLGTVMSRLHRARRRLRETLADGDAVSLRAVK